MKPIVKFYKDFTADLGVTVGEDGALLLPSGKEGNFKHWLVNVPVAGKRKNLPIYLPDAENIAREEDGARIMFHPACESILRGNSEILNKIIQLMSIRIYSSVMVNVDALLRAAADVEGHSKLPLPLMEVIGNLPTVSPATITHWAKVTEKVKPTGRWAAVTLGVRRDVELSGVQYKRACGVTSPLLNSVDLFGVKMTKIAEHAIRGAFELTTGELDFTLGSDSPTAPTFIAVANVYHRVMSQCDKMASYLSSVSDKEIHYSGKWHKRIGKLHDWYRNDFYLQLTGNIGAGPESLNAEGVEDEPVLKPLAMPPVTVDNVIPMTVEPLEVESLPVVVPVIEERQDGLVPFKRPVPVQQPPIQQQYGGYPQQPPIQQQYGGYPQQGPVIPQAPQQQAVGKQYLDPRTGTYKSTGGGSPMQQPQRAAPINYPSVPGYKGPIYDANGTATYINLNTGVPMDASAIMQGLQNNQAHGNTGGLHQPTVQGYDSNGNPYYN